YVMDRSTNCVFTGCLDITQFATPAVNSGTQLFCLDTGTDRGMGLTQDADGNWYIVVEQAFNGGSNDVAIQKYDPAGNLITTVNNDGNQGNNVNNGEGDIWGARGIVYSPSSNLLYVSNRENCISVFNTDMVQQVGLNVGNPANGVPKGIGLVTECCPTNNNQNVEITLCEASSVDPIFLNEIFPCDGGITCEAQWTPDAMSMAVFDPCTQSIQAGAAAGCYIFTRSSDGAGANAQCGAFIQTLTVAIGEVTSTVLSGDQEVCSAAEIVPFNVDAAATGSGTLSFQWFSSIESDSTGFMSITGATSESYTPVADDLTADTIYFRNIVSIENCTGLVCNDTSNVVIIINSGELPLQIV
ncbi:MAG: hypothetical protein AAFN81_35450, partial [Bacteroidota bacterium]